MRIRTFFVLPIFIGFLAAIPEVQAQTGNNLLAPYNPDFASKFTDWSGNGFSNAKSDAGAPGAGEYSAELFTNTSNAWNVLVNVPGTIPVTAGNAYVLTFLTRQNIAGGIAQTGLNILNSSTTSTSYLFGTVSNDPNWHSEYLTLVPPAGASFVRVYLWVQQSGTSGAAWWDDLQLYSIPNPFVTNANESIQVSLPTVTFNYDGTSVTPATLTPSIDVGQNFVGGVVAWQLTKETDGTGGTPLLQDTYTVVQSGTWQWPVNMSQLASLGSGRYLFTVTAVTADGSETATITKPLAVASGVSSIGSSVQDDITSSTIDGNGRLLVNDDPYQAVMYYETATSDFPAIRALGATSVEVTGNSGTALAASIQAAWNAGLYSWVVLFQPPFVVGSGSTTTWVSGTLQGAVNQLKGMPGVLGWVLDDEPDGHGIPPDVVQDVYDAIKAVDSDHVVWTNLARASTFGEYTGCSDIASYDSYAFPFGGLSTISSMNAGIKEALPGLPLISVLQAWAPVGFPSFSQLRAELYTDVCDGMVHSFYYAWSAAGNRLNNQPEMQSYTQLLNWEMQQLQPFLFSTDPFLTVTSGNANIRVVAKNVGTNVILIMVNQSAQPVQDVTVMVSGKSFTSNSAFFPGTSAGTLSGGQLVDSLPSYGVGIYQLH